MGSLYHGHSPVTISGLLRLTTPELDQFGSRTRQSSSHREMDVGDALMDSDLAPLDGQCQPRLLLHDARRPELL